MYRRIFTVTLFIVDKIYTCPSEWPESKVVTMTIPEASEYTFIAGRKTKW